jgi:hypothetical protein
VGWSDRKFRKCPFPSPTTYTAINCPAREVRLVAQPHIRDRRINPHHIPHHIHVHLTARSACSFCASVGASISPPISVLKSVPGSSRAGHDAVERDSLRNPSDQSKR